MIPKKHFFRQIKRVFKSIKGAVMIPEKHFFRQMKKVFTSVLLYIGVSSLIICVFWFCFEKLNCKNSFFVSVDSFFGMIPEDKQSIHFLALLESLSREIIIVMLLGTIISKMLYPLNPIYLCDYIVLDDAGLLQFRYFSVLKKGTFLYDAHIRVVVSDSESMKTGEGKLTAEFSEQLEMIKGVRSCVLDFNQTANILNKLYSNEEKKRIYFIIKGTDEDGVCYTRIKAYRSTAIVEDCNFLSIRRSEYQTLDVVQQLHLPDDMFPPVTEGEFIRYQNFNKLYSTRHNKESDGNVKKDDVLSPEQIVHGEFLGIKQVLLDVRSMIISLYLEGDFKVLKRWFQYRGNVLIKGLKSRRKK